MTEARQRLVLFAAVAIALIAATVLTLRNGDADDDVRGYLGPTPGPATSSREYVATKDALLARLARGGPEREGAALVSLQRYVSAPAAQSIARGLDPAVVFVRFPSSEAEPIFVETTIAGAVADAASDLRKEVQIEIDALEERATKAQGTERADVDELLAQRRADYAKIDADCGCVFAFAVEGAELSELRELRTRRFVRLVDLPDPLVSDLGGWELAPLVPSG